MPSRSKRQSKQIVIRSIEPGARHATKSVLGTLTKLNQHKPHLKSAEWSSAGALGSRSWKPPKPQPAACRPKAPRRNPGRDDGKTWMSPHFVCGRAMGPVWDGGERDEVWESDVAREWAKEDVSADVEDAWGHDRVQVRREVNILDIAKPMKPKGVSKEFQVVETVQRVIALEDDDMSEWASQIDSDLDSDEWDMLDEEMQRGEGSYAELARLHPD